jgi:hypothetical protein
VVASAYSNSFIGTSSTTLYGIDSTLNLLVTQSPPNDGTLVSAGAALGLDVEPALGFDIALTGAAFAAMTPAGTPGANLYAINLTTGIAVALGAIGSNVLVETLAAAP